MSTNELIELFGIMYPTLKANIKAIYKNGILNECEVQRYIKLYNGISIDVYALPMIIALSFRLNTLGAYKVRECVMNKLKTFRVTPENLAAFCKFLPPRSGELRANEIFFGKYSFVPIKINTFALNSID